MELLNWCFPFGALNCIDLFCDSRRRGCHAGQQKIPVQFAKRMVGRKMTGWNVAFAFAGQLFGRDADYLRFSDSSDLP